jgi:uncharacterized membrane protein
MSATAASPSTPRSEESSKAAAHLRHVTAQNVATVLQIETADHERRSTSDRAADAVTAFCGSISFIWTHVVWFVGWIGFNVLAGGRTFDPFPFPLLTLVVSLEAIFLSTFILISENRQARIGDRRNQLDLQINLLAEQENTKMLKLLRRIAEQVGVVLEDRETVALEAATDTAELTEEIDRQMSAVERGNTSTAPGPNTTPSPSPSAPRSPTSRSR